MSEAGAPRTAAVPSPATLRTVGNPAAANNDHRIVMVRRQRRLPCGGNAHPGQEAMQHSHVAFALEHFVGPVNQTDK